MPSAKKEQIFARIFDMYFHIILSPVLAMTFKDFENAFRRTLSIVSQIKNQKESSKRRRYRNNEKKGKGKYDRKKRSENMIRLSGSAFEYIKYFDKHKDLE